MLEKYRYKFRMMMRKIFGSRNSQNLENPKEYWDARFEDYGFHHSRQNSYIAHDFLQALPQHKDFFDVLQKSTSLLEVGCGTGEFSHIMAGEFPQLKTIAATDISKEGIQYANKRNKYPDRVKYLEFDSLKDNQGFTSLGKFELALCSNVLEHFTNPYPLIEQMLDACKYVCILVPYNHLSDDQHSGDGGEGHVFRFTEESFAAYQLISTFKFKSKGWSNVTNHPDPWQLTVLITKKS